MRCRAARALKARWIGDGALLGADARARVDARRARSKRDETLVTKGDARARRSPTAPRRLRAEYYWPMQTHGSMGPSCAVADVRDGKATVWTASQATHRFRDDVRAAARLPTRRGARRSTSTAPAATA